MIHVEIRGLLFLFVSVILFFRVPTYIPNPNKHPIPSPISTSSFRRLEYSANGDILHISKREKEIREGRCHCPIPYPISDPPDPEWGWIPWSLSPGLGFGSGSCCWDSGIMKPNPERPLPVPADSFTARMKCARCTITTSGNMYMQLLL